MAGLDAKLEPIPTPAGTEFPGTPDGLFAQICAYIKIVGLGNFNGVNYGANEPSADDRDKPWFKTDASGDPLGWYSWNGNAWIRMPVFSSTGTDRPLNPVEGQQFFDEEIHVQLVWERGKWRTLSGSPGDVKEVKNATIEGALKCNPGWVVDDDSVGAVVAAADPDYDADSETAINSHPFGDAIGEETHVLSKKELPAEGLGIPGAIPGGNGEPLRNDALADLNRTLHATDNSKTENMGEGKAMSLMQPTIYYWRLVKE